MIRCVCLVGVLAGWLVVPSFACAETRLGIEGGVSLASYDLEDPYPGVEFGIREGFVVGINAEFSLNNWLWLRVDPMYVQKGAEVDFPPVLDVADNTQEYDYAVVPVSLKGTIQTGPVSPFGLLGLGVGFVLSNETAYKTGETVEDAVDLEEPDVTLELGLGVDIPASGTLTFTLEGRYSLGLVSIESDPDHDLLTRTVLIMGGVNVRL